MSNVIAAVVIAAILAALFFGGTWALRLRGRRIAASRQGESFEDFAQSFHGEVPLDILEAVYGYFSDWMSDAGPHFPVRGSDSIYKIYGIVDEDLDDAALEILGHCHREAPSDFRPLLTVSDLAYYVAAGSTTTVKA